MQAAFFKQCNTCKGDIDFGDDYFVCSVSTCQRKATDFSFCSPECWDAHVPLFRHRDAWAEEKRAPSQPPEPATARPVSPKPPTPPPTSTSARPTNPPAAHPSQETGPLPAPELNDRGTIARDVLVVASKLKAYIRARSGMNTSDGVLPVLSEALRDLCDDAILRAAQDERKTVMDRDF